MEQKARRVEETDEKLPGRMLLPAWRDPKSFELRGEGWGCWWDAVMHILS